MNIAFLGPACAGKSTQAARVARPFGLRHLSTGKLMRDHFDRHTALGILAKKYVASGDLVPDDMVDAMVEEVAHHTPPDSGLLFDGFPGTLPQARFLDGMFQGYGRKLDAVFYLHIPSEAVFERASQRIPRRADDTVEILTNRLRVFHRNTAPVLQHFLESGRLAFIDGSGSIDAVHNQFVLALGDLLAGQRPKLSEAQRAIIEHLGRPTAAVFTPPSQPRLNFVLIGGPGSGKGTQADFLCTDLGLPHISTGDLFRDHMEKRTELGRIARAYIDHGDLVPDDVTESMVRDRLAQPDCIPGFVLDGFPRTLPQAHALEDILTGLNRQLTSVLHLGVPDEEIVQRLSGRRICRECKRSFHLQLNPFTACPDAKCHGEHLFQRDDDTPETVQVRLKKFHTQTEPLIAYYRNQELLVDICGSGEVSEVRGRLVEAVKQVRSKVGH
jgi:adenylate kinase